MSDFFTSIFAKIKEYWTGLTPKERKRIIILGVSVVVLSVIVALILGRVEYSVLYNDLTAAEAGEMVTALEGMGVPLKVEGTDRKSVV